MKIIDLIGRNGVLVGASAQSKEDIIDQAIEIMHKKGNISDVAAYKKAILAREEEGTTGVGMAVAIPHGKGDFVASAGLVAMTIPDGVDFDSLDGEPVKLLFMIAAPNTKDNVHLDVLAKLSGFLVDDELIEILINAKNSEEFLSILDSKDVEEESVESPIISSNESTEKTKLLAVTSCPTGIAHTYMAAEALTKAAEKYNCTIKVETRGSSGTKNEVSAQEIAEAKAIIIAADSKVPMDRFNGKHIIECKVSDGIHKAEELVQRAKNQDAPIFSSANQVKTETIQNASFGRQIYTQLMNGVSHMLPFVVGGGLLIALAFLIDGLSVDLNSLSESERGNFGSITPLAALLKTIGGTAFAFMLPVLAGFIAQSIGDRPALAPGFVGGMIAASGKSGFLGALVAGFLAGYIIRALMKGTLSLPETLEKIAPVLIYPLFGILFIGVGMIYIVEPVMGTINTGLNSALASMGSTSKVVLGFVVAAMMAIDMGGPFNKAAYVFGTASIVSGNYDIMAAVMIGGMTPPCAIALSAWMSKNKYTKAERDSAPMSFIMGLAFITEGAIPYAAADPIRVLPSCMLGSGVAGALSMFFGAKLMAPHGGIFVFPVVEQGLMYLLALVVGIVVSALMLGFLKKPIEE